MCERTGLRAAELGGRVHTLSECVEVCVVYAHLEVGH